MNYYSRKRVKDILLLVIMIFFKIFSFLLFVNLYNSFKNTNMNYKLLKNSIHPSRRNDFSRNLSIRELNKLVKSITESSFQHYKSNKIFMGCDYYILQNLYIYYNDHSFHYINLHRDRGYYSQIFDDFIMNTISKDDSISKWKKIKNFHLEPRAVPFLIYNNNSFNNIYLSNKYKEIIDFQINNNNKTWDDIKEIVIIEERPERD